MYLKRTLLAASLSMTLWAQTPAADPQKVVATVAGKDVTVADVQKMLATFSPQMMQTFQMNPQDMLGRYYLVVHLAAEADKAKLLEKSPYKEQFESVKLQVLSSARVSEENNSFPVSAEMTESYYQEHRSQYEQAKIKVIYLSHAGQALPTGADAAELAKQILAASQAKRSEAEARALADDIVKQLRGGADFAKLAEQYSEDPVSKAAGGDFGVIKAVSEYPAELKSAVFALKSGEVSQIRQPNAIYIVRLEEKGPQPLNEVREPIILTLRDEHMNQWMKEMNASFQANIKDPDYFKTAGAPQKQ